MKKIFTAFSIFSLSIVNCHLHSQGWFRTLDVTPYHEFTGDVAQTPDGGYVAVGSDSELPNSSSGIKDIVVIKTDADGEVQWTQVLDYKSNMVSYRDKAPKVVSMPDGTIIVAATTYFYNSGDGNMTVWRLDPSGNTLSVEKPASIAMSDLIQTSSGGLAAAGTYYKFTGIVSPYDQVIFNGNDRSTIRNSTDIFNSAGILEKPIRGDKVQ